MSYASERPDGDERSAPVHPMIGQPLTAVESLRADRKGWTQVVTMQSHHVRAITEDLELARERIRQAQAAILDIDRALSILDPLSAEVAS